LTITFSRKSLNFPGFTAALQLCVGLLMVFSAPAHGQQTLACGVFTRTPLAAPASRDEPHWYERFGKIVADEANYPSRVLFLGDSLTERWAPDIWQQNLASLGAVNAGVDGDRTEHLLWRIEHSNLPQPRPPVLVLLIGTNDLGHGRPPELAAEGIRRDLQRLRELAPESRILLLGLTPRTDRFGPLAEAVNPYIRTCAGGPVTYADLGPALRDPAGHINRDVIGDGVHFTPAGYRLITEELRRHLDPLLPN
jgi:lysophospholipase L1-like esterase